MRLNVFPWALRQLQQRFLCLLLLAGSWAADAAMAASVRLAWDPSLESGVAGYRVYRGASAGVYDWSLNVGALTQADITDLVSGVTYYFVVTAYNAQGVQTAPSNELIYQAPFSGTPPLAKSAVVSVIEDGSVAVVLGGSTSNGGTLGYEIATPPANGTLTGIAPSLTYRPSADFFGSDSFTFRTRDASGYSLPATVSITVTPVNDAPLAFAQADVFPSAGWGYDVYLEGFDADGDLLTFQIVTAPAHGLLEGIPPDLTYTPDIGYNGGDFLTFVVSDGILTSSPARVDFGVSGSVASPVADNSAVTLLEDTSVAITLTGSDPSGGGVIYSISQYPSKGSLTGIPPQVTYRPDPNVNGVDSFQFTVSNGSVVSTPAVVTLTITPLNDAPTAGSKTLTFAEDGLINLFLAGNDVDGDALTYQIVRAPSLGTLSGTAPALIYRPSANANGVDSFTYKVSDGRLTSPVATFTLNVTPQNDPPTANSQSVSVPMNSAVNVVLAGTDIDGDVLAFAITRAPANGALGGTPPNVRYTPRAGFAGSDSFAFTASDGLLTSAAATVSVTVTASTGIPTASPQSLTVVEDGSVTIRLAGTDPEGTPLAYTIVTPPTSGELSGTAADWVYRPIANFNGSDSFSFTVSDGVNVSAPATVAIGVTPVNDAPKATSKTLNVAEDGLINLFLSGQDVDGDALTYTVVTAPTLGTLSGTAPALIYRPAPNATGTDSFTYTVSDGRLSSAIATFTLTIQPVNDAPVAVAQAASVVGGSSVNLVLAGTDVDGDALTFAIAQAPVNGVLSGTAPNVRYTPKAGFTGLDSLTFTVSDGLLTSAPATVALTVTAPTNAVPTAQPASLTLGEDGTLAVRLAGSDPEGAALTFRVVTAPTKGALSGTAPNLTYTPQANFAGTDSFTFTVSDGVNTSPSAKVTLTVTPVNDLPVAVNKSIVVPEDGSVGVTLGGSDVEGDALTFAIVRAPARGTLSGTPPALIYRSNPNANGTDSFTYTASDAGGSSAPATISITITPVNDAPVAIARSESVTGGSFVDLTLAGSDVDGDALTFGLSALPVNGTISGIPPTVRYTPRAGFTGTDSFSFTVNDGTATSAAAVVALTVTAPLGIPTANSLGVTVAEDTSVAIQLSGNDPDGGLLTYQITQLPAKGTLLGTPPALTYRPSTHFSGADSLAYTVSDGTYTSLVATVAITVTPVNDAPVSATKSLATAEDKAINVILAGSDADGDPLTFTIVRAPANGTLSGTAPNLLYRPNPNFSGIDSLSYTVSDGTAVSAAGTYTINVTPVNDAPVASGLSLATPKNETLALRVVTADADGDTLSFTLTQAPTNGVLTGVFPDFQYAPTANYTGADAFKFTVFDGALTSAVATVSLQVTPTNHVSVALDGTLTLGANQSAGVRLNGTDADGDVLGFQLQSAPLHGVLSGSAPDLQYRPTRDYDGPDSFTFVVTDGVATSLVAMISISVVPTNNAPTAISSELILAEDTSVAVRLTGADVDGDALSYQVVQAPTKGALVGTPPTLTYRPSLNFAGTDTLKYVVSDGSRTSAVATITFTVEGVNDAPRAYNKTLSLLEDGVVNAFPGGTDPDGDPLTFAVVRPPANGTLTAAGSGFVYRPNPDFAGVDSFTYTASDGQLTSAAATFTLNVTAVNDAPIALAQNVVVARGSDVPILLGGLDPEGAALVFTLLDAPTNGVVSGTPPNLTYTATNLSANVDAFRFIVSDGDLVSAPAAVSISLVAPALSEVLRSANEAEPRLLGLRFVGEGLQLQLQLPAGSAYWVEYRSDWPNADVEWLPLQRLEGQGATILQWVDRDAAKSGQRFYRLRAAAVE